MPNQFVTELFERLKTEFISKVVSATVPFFHLKQNPFTQVPELCRDRSGVLLRIADEHFILTASHEIEYSINNEIYLAVGWDEDEHVPIPINRSQFFATEETDRDIAVIKLARDVAKKILIGHKPISMLDIAKRGDRATGLFLVSGYPRAWTKMAAERIEPRPLTFLGRRCKDEWNSADDLNYDKNLHVVVRFSQDAIRTDNFEKVVLPYYQGIQGISGCGIWHVADFPPKTLKSWRAESCKLAAIEHRYFERARCVAGTWIDFAIERLAEGCPEMRPALNLIYE